MFKIGDLFIALGIKGDSKELDKANKRMEKAEQIKEKTSKNEKKRKQEEKKSNSDTIKNIKAASNAVKSLSQGIKGVGGALSGVGGVVGAVGAVVGAVTVAYMAIDRMVTSLASANQQMITFQRQTGISFASLNKYASANAAVNFNSSIEGTAQSMQRLANNLWDIQMGRGDVSPYQELAFVGGKAFNPFGMSVEEVIENVREAIKGVDDLQATNIITRMGFSPDDLLMLRMSREEFEQINDLFISPASREAINKYALELKKVNLEQKKLNDLVSLDLSKSFVKTQSALVKLEKFLYVGFIKPVQLGFKFLKELVVSIGTGIKDLVNNIIQANESLKPIFSALKMLFELIWLPIEDFITYLSGGDSLIGRGVEQLMDMFENLEERWKNSKIVNFFEGIKSGIGNLIPPTNQNNINYGGNSAKTSNVFYISTQQPLGTVAEDLINRFTPLQAVIANDLKY